MGKIRDTAWMLVASTSGAVVGHAAPAAPVARHAPANAQGYQTRKRAQSHALAVPESLAVQQAQFLRRARQCRQVTCAEIGEMGWDMLTTLFLRTTKGRQLTIQRLSGESFVPLTTGLRVFGLLEEHSLVRRELDGLDGRPGTVALTELGATMLDRYFSMIGSGQG